MEILRGTIISSDSKNYEVTVRLDNSGQEIVASPLSPVSMEISGSGLFTNPNKYGQKCQVLQDGFTYWILGYYIDSSGLSIAGFIDHPDYPRPLLGGGDTLIRHPSGSSIHLSDEELRIFVGTGASINLRGDIDNSIEISSFNFTLDQSCGYLKWKLLNDNIMQDNPSSFTLLVRKNFEQFADVMPSDYIQYNLGTIGADDHVFELNTMQYMPGSPIEGARTYLSLSKDSRGNYMRQEFEDMQTGAHSYHRIIDGYTHELEIEDISRSMKQSWMGDSYLSLEFDSNYSYVIENNGDVSIEAAGYYQITNDDIRLGGKDVDERLVLGDIWMGLMKELFAAIKSIQLNHPQGPTLPVPINWGDFEKIQGKLEDALSEIAKTKKK